jgi:hypothetical protein
MRRRTMIESSAAGLFALLAAGAADARPGLGNLASRSRASVQISLSVAPRFNVVAHRLAGDGISLDRLTVSSNAERLRYALVVQPVAESARTEPASQATGGGAPPRRATETRLVLVVPD